MGISVPRKAASSDWVRRAAISSWQRMTAGRFVSWSTEAMRWERLICAAPETPAA